MFLLKLFQLNYFFFKKLRTNFRTFIFTLFNLFECLHFYNETFFVARNLTGHQNRIKVIKQLRTTMSKFL